MSIGFIDIIAISILIFSILFALYRGLIRELLGIASWILAGFLGIYSYEPMQPIMQKFIENKQIAGLCGAAIIALIVLVFMTIINAHINKKLRESSLSGLDRLLGLVFGFIRAVLFMVLIYVGAVTVLSDKQIEELEKDSFSLSYIKKTAEFMKRFVPENVQSDLGMNENKQKNGKPKKKIGTDLKRNHKLPERSKQKAVQRFVDEVKKETVNKVVEKQIETTKEKINTTIQEKTKNTKENEITPQYNKQERDSLDNMVEKIMEKEA